MTLKAKLVLLALAPMLVVLAVGGLEIYTSRAVKHSEAARDAAEAIIRDSMELSLLTHEYLAQPGNERVLGQWRENEKALAASLATASAVPTIQDEVFESMTRSHRRVVAYFAKLSRGVHEGGAASLAKAWAADIKDGIFVELHALAASAGATVKRSHEALVISARDLSPKERRRYGRNQ